MRKQPVILILAGLAVLNLFAWLAVVNLSPQFLEVSFFDVGQGDSAFIETPSRQQILIDGGPDSSVLAELAKVMPFWDRTIDLIILTHPEKDHLSGLLEVLKKYQVENILWTGVVRETAEYKEWAKLIKQEGAKIFIAKPGQKVKLAQGFLEILAPFADWQGKEAKDSNASSIVSRLVFGSNSFLFTGDIRAPEEREFILRGANIKSSILKVAHHGSKTSSSDEFIARVLPEAAIISVGQNNTYGHPTKEVLDTLAKYGIKVFRTDLNKNIKIISDGQNYQKI